MATETTQEPSSDSPSTTQTRSFPRLKDIAEWRVFLTVHPFVSLTVIDKLRGVMFGSALGDAVGLYTGIFYHQQAFASFCKTVNPRLRFRIEFLSEDMSTHAYPERRFRLLNPTTEFRNDGHRSEPI
jgi:hypothetical protein